jgi:HEAT repeat protein
MVPFLKDGPEVSEAAAAALGNVGSLAAVEALDEFRKTVPKDRWVMADDAYVRAVETLDPAGAVPLWKRLVAAKEESRLVRRVALLRLSEQAPETALPWLSAALREEDAELRPVAGQALRSLQDKQVMARLLDDLPRFPASSQVIVIEAVGQPPLPFS